MTIEPVSCPLNIVILAGVVVVVVICGGKMEVIPYSVLQSQYALFHAKAKRHHHGDTVFTGHRFTTGCSLLIWTQERSREIFTMKVCDML